MNENQKRQAKKNVLTADFFSERNYTRNVAMSATAAGALPMFVVALVERSQWGAAHATALGIYLATAIFVLVLVADGVQRRRQHQWLVSYVQSLREYAVGNIEHLQSVVGDLSDDDIAKPPVEVPDSPSRTSDLPLGTRERNTLLAIIAALCKHANIDYARPAKAASTIKSMTVELGLNVGETTIEEHLKKIADAVEARSR